jgi:hypothetical protein
MRPLLLIALLAALGCGPAEDRSDLQRRPVSAPASSGWARLPLDGPSQKALPELWLSDATGTPIPYQLEREGLWQPLELQPKQLLLGRDGQGRPSAEFSLELPADRQVRDREHLKLAFQLEGPAPWSCRVEVERRLEGGAYLQLETPLHLFDLGSSGRRAFCYIPWDAAGYRLTLVPTQGEPPKLLGLAITASTRPEQLEPDAILVPAVTAPAPGGGTMATWILSLPAAERIVAAELLLAPPVAPFLPNVRSLAGPGRQRAGVACAGVIWNLPALNDQSTRLELGPVVTDRLELELPRGVLITSVKLLVRRDVLLFPAAAGQSLFLHTGGQARRAPGNLAELPVSSRALYGQAPLRLGPPESDPQGLPRLISGSERTRPWLPWATGVVVLLLGYAAWGLLKPE